MKNNVKVKTKNLPQSALKLRLVVDLVRGMKADEALVTLDLLNKKGSHFVKETLKSAVAAADEQYEAESKNLLITHISVDEAPTLKRHRFASRGRVSEILKRRSNINLELTVVK